MTPEDYTLSPFDRRLVGRERIYGSERFRSLTRRTDLVPPKRFEPTRKEIGDVII